ncbi:hypothetical protein D3Z55_23965 [Clostridiaceae bacterium]|nr:hypothetical protein [Clostridiaceae bacterium]
MKRQLKTVAALAAAAAMTMASVMTASAATWKQDMKGWWVENEDGSYLTNQWYQSPASGLWYYMGADGYMLTNTTTPDGYFVNADGAWVENEAVSNQPVITDGESVGESDFIVNGENLIWDWDVDSDTWFFQWYAEGDGEGDNITTYRGISFKSNREDVTNAYGKAPVTVSGITAENDTLYNYYLQNDNSAIFLSLGQASYIQYPLDASSMYVGDWANYDIRFYFDSNDKVVCIAYMRNAASIGS